MILAYSNKHNIFIAFDRKVKKAIIYINDMNDKLIKKITLENTDFKKINIDKNIDKVKLKIETNNKITQKHILLT